MAGTITVGTISDGTNSASATDAIKGSARAWVNFDSREATLSVRSSYNVSSVTDNGAGDYTMNFSTAMPDANYVFTTNHQDNPGYYYFDQGTTPYIWSASSMRMRHGYGATTLSDADTIMAVIHR